MLLLQCFSDVTKNTCSSFELVLDSAAFELVLDSAAYVILNIARNHYMYNIYKLIYFIAMYMNNVIFHNYNYTMCLQEVCPSNICHGNSGVSIPLDVVSWKPFNRQQL